MTPLTKGLLVGAAQVLLVAGVGARFLFDHAVYQRVWVRTAPVDPDLPVRGRYVSLRAIVDARPPQAVTPDGGATFAARLAIENDRLVAIADEAGWQNVTGARCGRDPCWTLSRPLAYFIPEGVADPSRREPGEELWVEVTVPPKGAPRPLQLGVKSGGNLEPLPTS
jgi:hypothetical protein